MSKPRLFALCCTAIGLMLLASMTHAFDIQGHRGTRGLMPENTLPAFARALTIGVTTLELDCAVTRDGVVVVSHDSTLNPDITRGPDGAWITHADIVIAQLSYAELQGYDVGRINPVSAYALRYLSQQSIDGTRMPRLADVFALARKAGNDSVRFNIETKISPLHPERTMSPEAFVRALIAVIKENNVATRVTIQSFDWRTLRVVQQEAPEIATIYLSAQQSFMDNILTAQAASPWNAGLHVSQFTGSVPKMVKAAGGAAWSPYYGEVTAENVKEAHALGLKVIPWTVNDEKTMLRMITLGVDGLISDYPDLLRQTVGGKGLPLPRATPVTP